MKQVPIEHSFLAPIVLDCSNEELKKLADLIGRVVVPNIIPLFKLSDFKTTVKITVDENDPYRFKWSLPITD